jgi:hypothetical protein
MIYNSNNSEIKYIIVKDNSGHLRHYTSDYLHHETIARDNGFDSRAVIECGMFLAGQLYILECISQEHLQRRAGNYIGNRLNEYHDIRLENWLKARTLEAGLYYSKKPIYQEAENKILPGGD